MPQLSPSIYLHSSCCNCFPEEMHCCHHAVFFSHDTMHYSFFRNYFLLLLQHSLLFFCMQQLYLIIKSLMPTSLYYNRSLRIEMWVLCCSQCGSENVCGLIHVSMFLRLPQRISYLFSSIFCLLISFACLWLWFCILRAYFNVLRLIPIVSRC